MEKRIFRNKIVYWISILFFLFGGTFFVSVNTQPFSINMSIKQNIFIVLMFIFSIIILVSLFNKENYATKLINIYIYIVLLINLKSFIIVILNNRFIYNNYIYKIDITIFLIIFLFLVNYFKVKDKDNKNLVEIDKQ